jgi:hypothetical protein
MLQPQRVPSVCSRPRWALEPPRCTLAIRRFIARSSSASRCLRCSLRSWLTRRASSDFALSGGALGSIVGFEAEWLYEDAFRGKTRNETSTVTTFMGNFLIAPRISIVQPYGLVGIGLMQTEVETVGASETENQIGWDIGGGVMVFMHRNIGIKGDIRYYHSAAASGTSAALRSAVWGSEGHTQTSSTSFCCRPSSAAQSWVTVDSTVSR